MSVSPAPLESALSVPIVALVGSAELVGIVVSGPALVSSSVPGDPPLHARPSYSAKTLRP